MSFVVVISQIKMNARLLIIQNSRFNNIDVNVFYLNIHRSQIVEEYDALFIDQ